VSVWGQFPPECHGVPADDNWLLGGAWQRQRANGRETVLFKPAGDGDLFGRDFLLTGATDAGDNPAGQAEDGVLALPEEFGRVAWNTRVDAGCPQ
jgi:hypothetical protein